MKNQSWILFLAVFFAYTLFCFYGCPEKKPCTTCPPPANDTTRHAFTFQQFSWGGGGASFLQDVAIINDTNIWAVGTIQPVEYDSLGKAIYRLYGVTHWNGANWKLIQIFDNEYNLPIAGIQGIFISNPNDIWLAAGSIFHWDGISTQAQISYLRPIGNTIITKIWGTSSSNLYGVGTGGVIVHFDGHSWQKLTSPTQLDFMDIYGATNQKTGELEVLAIATQVDSIISRSQLLRIQGTSVSLITTLPKIYFSLWFVPGEKYYVVGDGIISTNSSTNPSWNNIAIGAMTQYEGTSIRGTALNDIFVTGSNLDVVHYNGSTWFDYANQIPSSYLGGYPGIALRGNTMIAVGFIDQEAILLVGKR